MEVNFKEIKCKAKRIDFKDSYGDYSGSSYFASIKFVDDQGKFCALYGFRIHENNGKFYLEKPKGVFVDHSLWKMIEREVLSDYEQQYSTIVEK